MQTTSSYNPQRNVITYLRGRGFPGYTTKIYDYARGFDYNNSPYHTLWWNPGPYFVNNVDINVAISDIGYYTGNWLEQTKYCYGNTSGYSGAVYMTAPLLAGYISYSSGVTMMCRFLISSFPTGSSAAVYMYNGHSGWGGFGVFTDPNTTNLWALSGGIDIQNIATNLTSGTWYSLVLTIGSDSFWTSYLNGSKSYLGYIGVNYIDIYDAYPFTFMGNAISGSITEGLNGYMTDVIFANQILPDATCISYSSGNGIM